MSSTEQQAEKPAPIRVGVEGFNAFEAKPDAPRAVIDWPRLEGLPAFEMFIAERYAHSSESVPFSQALYDEYCQWHTDKGYWPNESPMGELL